MKSLLFFLTLSFSVFSFAGPQKAIDKELKKTSYTDSNISLVTDMNQVPELVRERVEKLPSYTELWDDNDLELKRALYKVTGHDSSTIGYMNVTTTLRGEWMAIYFVSASYINMDGKRIETKNLTSFRTSKPEKARALPEPIRPTEDVIQVWSKF